MGDFDLTYFHHELFEHTTHKYNPINISHNLTMNLTMTNEYNVLCVIRYSRSVQTYNTITLFIIFGTARRRSITQTNKKSFKQHVISPFILLVLALPRLIMSLIFLLHHQCLSLLYLFYLPNSTEKKNIQRFNNTMVMTNSSIIFDYDQLSACCIKLLLRFASFLI